MLYSIVPSNISFAVTKVRLRKEKKLEYKATKLIVEYWKFLAFVFKVYLSYRDSCNDAGCHPPSSQIFVLIFVAKI